MKNIYKVNEEAVKKIAERVYDNGSTVINRNDLEEMFPELKKESEDERIRKALIYHYQGDGCICTNEYRIDYKDIRTWLEKQGEHANFRNKIQIGDKVTRNEDGVLVNLSQLNRVAKKDEKQGEQKPVEMKSAEESLGISSDEYNKIVDECIFGEQKPTEVRTTGYWHVENAEQNPTWREEDIRKIKLICTYLDAYKAYQTPVGAEYIDGCISWAKALISRVGCEANCTTMWRPSEEQMRVLDLAIRCGINRGTTEETTLVSLFNDLKKLKG